MEKNILKSIWIIAFIIQSNFISAQTIDALDIQRGFKDFKIGDSFSKWSKDLQSNNTWDDGTKIYTYIGSCCDMVFQYPVESIFIRFENEKIIGIIIKLEKFQKEFDKSGQYTRWRKSDFESINSSFSDLFGKETSVIKPENTSEVTFVWEGNKVTLASQYKYLGVEGGDQQTIVLFKPSLAPLYSNKNQVTDIPKKYIPPSDKDFDARLHFCKLLAIQAKDYDRAITEAKRLIVDAPNYKVANRWIAWAAFEKAAKIEVDALKAGRKSPFGDGWKALLQESNTASKALMAAVPADHLRYYDYQYAAKSAQKLGNIDEALEMYSKVIETDPNLACPVYTDLTNIYYEQKKYKEGFAMLDKKITNDCKIAAGEYFYAMYYACATNDTTAGIKYADKYIELVPNGSDGYHYKALCQRKSDTQDPPVFNAKETYEKLIKLHETTPDDRSKTYVVKAYLYLAYYSGANSDLDKVKEYAQKVLAIEPTNERALQLMSF